MFVKISLVCDSSQSVSMLNLLFDHEIDSKIDVDDEIVVEKEANEDGEEDETSASC
jgi:hypothetical protein